MWPEGVQRVADFLRGAHAEARIEEFGDHTPTAEDAARAVGAPVAQIVKSLVFVCDGRPVLVLVPGDRRADAAKIAAAARAQRARVASRDEVVRATGFAPGSVAPFPHPGIETVVIDRTLLAHEHVWVGAGSPNHLVSIRPPELVRLTRARAMDAVGDREYDSS